MDCFVSGGIPASGWRLHRAAAAARAHVVRRLRSLGIARAGLTALPGRVPRARLAAAARGQGRRRETRLSQLGLGD